MSCPLIVTGRDDWRQSWDGIHDVSSPARHALLATLRLPGSKPDDVSGAATVHYLRLAFSSIRLARSLA